VPPVEFSLKQGDRRLELDSPGAFMCGAVAALAARR
jgi:hypothetical protein